jgi:hypothetical protein
MVAGQRETVDHTHPLGLTEAQKGRDPEFEAQPYQQPVYRSCPAMAPDPTGQRTESSTPAGTERPMGSLDKAPALVPRRAPQQGAYPTRALAGEGLRRGLFHQPQLGRHDPHSRHRHRAKSPARSPAENVTHPRTNVRSCGGNDRLTSSYHKARLLG